VSFVESGVALEKLICHARSIVLVPISMKLSQAVSSTNECNVFTDFSDFAAQYHIARELIKANCHLDRLSAWGDMRRVFI
jgi:hypothetical protein